MPEELLVEAPATPTCRPEPIAPWAHSVFVLAVLALMASMSARFSPVTMASAMSRSLMYIVQIAITCLLTGSTVAGLYHRRQFIAAAFGPARFAPLRDIAQGFLIYLGGMATTILVGIPLLLTHRLAHKTGVVSGIAPHSIVELPLWILVSLTAGVCEEFLFRGYLLEQFRRWFGSAWVAVALSSILFACMHFYEGAAAALQIGALGAFYAIVAVRRGNLRSVMIAHFFQDALTGLFLFLHR